MDELIRLCATAARVACLRMTPLYLEVLPDSVEQARRMPSKVRLGPQGRRTRGIFNLC